MITFKILAEYFLKCNDYFLYNKLFFPDFPIPVCVKIRYNGTRETLLNER